MSRLIEGCEHPSEWLLKLKMDGRTYTYCLGCIVEKNGMNNLEVYDNPYIKGVAKKVIKTVEPKKEKEIKA